MKNTLSSRGFVDRVSDIVRRAFPWPVETGAKVTLTDAPRDRAGLSPMIGLEALEPLPALLLSRSAALEHPGNWLADAGFWVAHSGQLQEEFQKIASKTHQWSVVMVAIDDFGGITRVIGDLIRLRQAVPELPVILLSAEVQGDDLSTVRKALCDATLRLPVSLPRFNTAICQAMANLCEHEEWGRVLHDIRYGARDRV